MLSTKNLINTIIFSIAFVCLILSIEVMKDCLKKKQKFESFMFGLCTAYETFMLINCPIFPWSVF